ncbi:hypothetical protein H072_57 [Dactylellina haptotyla CBS 200.50]|uniref:Uncharacterized protein n=1 Tax=Dactylellina haptotyla (strain CBS 200.50) TaxID=1284197 RepID=S8C2R7_DACHA|nr:hypothetical protein H072_57 [Dactylellina haptotyla CBS 200.50]
MPPTTPSVLSGLANISIASNDEPSSSQKYFSSPFKSLEDDATVLPLKESNPPDVYGDLVRPLHFFAPPRYGSPPRFLVAHPNGSGIKNFGTTPTKVTIRDMRNKEHRFHLALHSFKLLRYLPAYPYPLDLQDPQTITTVHNSITDIIRLNVTSANQITIFSTAILKAKNTVGAPYPNVSYPMQVDQTPGGAILRAKRHLTPDIAAQVAMGTLSLRIVTVYRPILPGDEKITDHQLCLAESLSIPDDYLVPVEHVYPDRVGQTYAVKHGHGQRFWYWSHMSSSEAIIVQVYDSLLGCDSLGLERMVRGATGFFRVMPRGWEEGKDAEWLVVRALVVA